MLFDAFKQLRDWCGGLALLREMQANVARGGDTLESLIAECPPELRERVFCEGFEVIPYLRLPQFQLQSMIDEFDRCDCLVEPPKFTANRA